MFRLETGERWTAIECSDFALFQHFLEGGADTIRPVLEERAAIGFNLLRVWLAYSGGSVFEQEIGRLVPSEHPEMYDQLPSFLSLCASYGLYVELTAFTGGPIPGHWDQIAGALEGVTNALVELCNENDSHVAHIDPRDYFPIPGIPCSHGSNGSQALPVRPWWQYETFHTNDAFEWWRKSSHNGMELSEGADGIPASHVPVITNETTRPDRDPRLAHHEDDAAACALLVAGRCCHTRSGKKSALFDAFDRPYAEAHVRGMRSVDLTYQEGRYHHPIELEGPDDLRVYQRILADGRAFTVHIRK